jgi:cysteine desulfurase
MKVTWLPVNENGHPDLPELEKALAQGGKALVTLMHANNELGTLLDIQSVGEICARHGALFHSDTVQAMAHVRYDLKSQNLDFLTASAHKFNGPKGIGFIYIKSGLKIPALICGGSQERNMRAGTENVAGIVGMAHALKKCYADFEGKHKHLSGLRARMLAGLQERIPGILVNGVSDPSKAIPTVLNVAFPSNDVDSMLLFNLDINGISASGGSACTSGSVKGSHVLSGIGLDPVRSANSVRFSFGIQNTMEEIDEALARIAQFMLVGA